MMVPGVECTLANNNMNSCNDHAHCVDACAGSCHCASVVENGASFAVGVIDPTGNNNRCDKVRHGDNVRLDIDLVYDVSYGGSVATKSSRGRIQMGI
jgi:hypothetical protein